MSKTEKATFEHYGAVCTVHLRGIFMYDGSVPTEVAVWELPFTVGSGDVCDAPEVAENSEAPSFCVQFGTPGEQDMALGGHGYFRTLAEAVAYADGVAPSIEWID